MLRITFNRICQLQGVFNAAMVEILAYIFLKRAENEVTQMDRKSLKFKKILKLKHL